MEDIFSRDLTKEFVMQSHFIDEYPQNHQNGPDYIIPTEDIRTWEPNGATTLDVGDTKIEDYWRPISSVTLMKKSVDKFPNNIALAVKRDGQWKKWTYSDYWNDVKIAARGFIKLGLVPFHGVGILGFNSPEWVISHLAAIFSGGFSAGIYTTNSPEACLHILKDCSANIVIVEDEYQLEKILKIRENLPHLKSIIQYVGIPKHPDVFSWSDLMDIGKSLPEECLNRRIKGLAINQCCCLIYTSGTTGLPKGVMLSHDNLIYEAKTATSSAWKVAENDVHISYLPLSHIAALAIDVYVSISGAAAVYFANPDALKGTLIHSMREIQPTSIFGVPRVYEKIYEQLIKSEGHLVPGKKNIMSWAKRQCLKYHLNMANDSARKKKFSYIVAKKIIFGEVRNLIGAEKIHTFLSAGAPLATETWTNFLSLDIKVLDGYGLSETSGYHTLNHPDCLQAGSVGKVTRHSEMEMTVLEPDNTGKGEILMRGRNVCMGYLKLETKTIETINDDRWIHSGDVGYINRDGYLYITSRIKEILITDAGENIPPVFIENTIKNFLPVVSNCMLIGDKRKYLTLIITLKVDLDPETMAPLDTLSPLALQWCEGVGSQAKTVSDIVNESDEKFMKGIQNGVNRYNKEKAISHAQHVQKWRILESDFSFMGGELGPTSKLKRFFVLEKYRDIIESMYSE